MVTWLVFLGLGSCVSASIVVTSQTEAAGGASLCSLTDVCISTETKLEYSYNPDNPRGPNKWDKVAACCGGQMQSPIDVPLSSASRYCFLPLQFTRPGPLSGELSNTGGSLKYDKLDKQVYMRGVPHMEYDIFTLADIHLHWGCEGEEGAEHKVEGVGFPAEVHLVFYNKKYGSKEDAMKYFDGFAVIAVLIQEGAETTCGALEKLMDQGSQLMYPEDKAKLHVDPLDFLPKDLVYATYHGSFTTPPCSQVVRWIVMIRPYQISHAQLTKLRELMGKEGVPIAKYGDGRPVQPLNQRAVETNRFCSTPCAGVTG